MSAPSCNGDCEGGSSHRGDWLVHIAVPPIGLQTSLSSLGTFSSSSIGGPVFQPIDDREHQLLYLPGTHKGQIYQGHVSKVLLAYAIVFGFGG